MVRHIRKNGHQQKTRIDKIIKGVLFTVTLFCASIILFIVMFIFIHGIKPFVNSYQVGEYWYRVNFWRFMTGTVWFQAPNVYGIGFIIINTLYVVGLALAIAAPVSIMTALFVSRIAPHLVGKVITTVIELLAAIPSIIYGLFGMGVVTNFVKNLAKIFNYQSAGGLSTLSTVIVLAIMIIPTITMISIASIKAVKRDMIDASLALGASPTQTNFKVVLKSAQSGIFSGIILGVGRALGEATAVSMVAGNRGSGPTFNLFDTTRTLTSTMLLGLKETAGLDYDIRFSVGIILICLIFGVNFLLNMVKRRLSR
jgi:phosphate transport system permease protein